MIRKTALALLLAAAGVNAHALTAGDVAIIAYNSDGADDFAWVALTDIAANTTINFTDSSWQGSAFRSTEHLDTGGPLTWTNTTTLSAGSVVSFSGNVSKSWSVGSGNTSAALGLSTSGDQIFAFQGSNAAPNFLYGLQFAHANGLIASPTVSSSTNTTNVPAGLSEAAGTMFNVGDFDDGYYSGITTGTQVQLLTAIANQANWTRSNDAYGQSSWVSSMSVTAVPEPRNYAMFLAGLGLMGLIARRQSSR
ncbi:MAG: PEP-CTERM sorting domain-containing protein [Azonexus sp.]|nr:PEP-CTERM sorting domain-containing protein [Azonexus sp.]